MFILQETNPCITFFFLFGFLVYFFFFFSWIVVIFMSGSNMPFTSKWVNEAWKVLFIHRCEQNTQNFGRSAMN